MPRMSGGQAVVECIRRAGVTHAFCVPGESFLAVLDACHDARDLTMVATRHEEGAGFMAEAYAKATGRPGVCLASRGPGATHLSIALHTARHDSTPLVALIGQVSRRYRHRDSFQEVELAELFRPITKWSVEVWEPERIPELVQRAFRVAESGRPGPVLLSLPEDMLSQEADMAFGPSLPPARPRPAPSEVEAAAELLAGARSVAIMAGLGVIRSGATPELIALSEALAAPVFTSFRRFDAFPNAHRHYLGGASPGMPLAMFAAFRQAEVVLAVGSRLSELTTMGYSMPVAGQRLIQIDVDPGSIGTVFSPAVAMVADARMALSDLLAALREQLPASRSDGAARRSEAVSEWRAEFEKRTTPRRIATAPVDPEGVMYDLNRLLPRETAIVSDAGNFSGWLNRFYRFDEVGTFFGPTAGGMGYAVPAAIGVRLALPGRPVVCFAGDGSFAMTAMEVQTAVRLGLDRLVFLVFNNRTYGTIRSHQEQRYPGRPVATDLGELDFAMVGQGLGAYGERVEHNDQLPAALERALTCGRPAVLELVTRPERLSAWA